VELINGLSAEDSSKLGFRQFYCGGINARSFGFWQGRLFPLTTQIKTQIDQSTSEILNDILSKY